MHNPLATPLLDARAAAFAGAAERIVGQLRRAATAAPEQLFDEVDGLLGALPLPTDVYAAASVWVGTARLYARDGDRHAAAYQVEYVRRRILRYLGSEPEPA
jgi:hypothetical protein